MQIEQVKGRRKRDEQEWGEENKKKIGKEERGERKDTYKKFPRSINLKTFYLIIIIIIKRYESCIIYKHNIFVLITVVFKRRQNGERTRKRNIV